jgi:hypothetical protein
VGEVEGGGAASAAATGRRQEKDSGQRQRYWRQPEADPPQAEAKAGRHRLFASPRRRGGTLV